MSNYSLMKLELLLKWAMTDKFREYLSVPCLHRQQSFELLGDGETGRRGTALSGSACGFQF